MFDWFKLALLVLGLARDFASWVEREKIHDDAQRQQLRDALEKIDEEVARADAARARVRADLDADPDKLRNTDDGFRRSDDEAG